MSARALSEYWRRGWSALLAFFLLTAGFRLAVALIELLLPDIAWLQVSVAMLLLVTVGPVFAWTVIQVVFLGAEPLKLPRAVVVATFSDEISAHVAAAALEQHGIRAIVSAGEIGPQSGLPMPVGGMQVLVASHDRAAAEVALASAHQHGRTS